MKHPNSNQIQHDASTTQYLLGHAAISSGALMDSHSIGRGPPKRRFWQRPRSACLFDNIAKINLLRPSSPCQCMEIQLACYSERTFRVGGCSMVVGRVKNERLLAGPIISLKGSFRACFKHLGFILLAPACLFVRDEMAAEKERPKIFTFWLPGQFVISIN